VDWYGDTIFNRHQIADLREELTRLAMSKADENERRMIRQVDMLAALCEAEPHLYLKFYGD